jgi:mannose-6-phosphate isomerase-like protein (cupin superfamily)
MITGNVKTTIGGWYIGNFENAIYKTNSFEASYKLHKKGEKYGWHYHEHLDEINLVVSGRMKIQGKEFKPGDIFVLEPYEIADPEFLEDCEIICIKAPNITNDKIDIKR